MFNYIKAKIGSKLAQKLYPFLEIESEMRERNNLNNALNKLKFKGKNIKITIPFQKLLGCQYIEIGNNFYAGIGLRIEALDRFRDQSFKPCIVFGQNFSCGSNCHIGAINRITLGDHVLLGSNIYITDHYHGQTVFKDETPPNERKLYSKGEVNIGNNVWIGDGVCIMPGVTLGDGVIVGANSVVTKSFPNDAVIGGCPAVVLKELHSPSE